MIPNKIKVAGITYEVMEKKDLAKDHSLLGQVLYHYGKIQLDPDIAGDRKEQVLIHEVLHAIFNEAGYTEQDEDLINRVSIVLHQVLKDNDFSWIREQQQEEGKTIVKYKAKGGDLIELD